MKEKLLAYVQKLKDLLAAKRFSMGAFAPHKPFVAEIEADEIALDSLKESMTAVDMDQEESARPTLLYLMLDQCVPVLRHWRERFIKIKEAHKLQNPSHLKASEEFLIEKQTMFDLIAQLNTLQNQSIIPIEDCMEPGKAVIAAFDKDKYLETHAIQETQSRPTGILSGLLQKLF